MTPMTTPEPVEVAALEHIALRDHRIHPEGHWDGSRFWLAEHELQSCCAGLAEPTWRWPYRQMSHARTAEHVAERHGVELRALRSTARRLRRMGLDRFSRVDAAAVLTATRTFPDQRIENLLVSWEGTASDLIKLAARL